MLTQTKIAEPTSVNGINVDDLSALIEDITQLSQRIPAGGPQTNPCRRVIDSLAALRTPE